MSGKGRVDIGFSGDANDVLKQLDRIISRQSKMIDGFTRAHQKSVEQTTAQSGMLGKVGGQLEGMVLRWASIGAATRIATGAMQEFTRYAKEAAESMTKFADATIDLQFMGDRFKDPKWRKKVWAVAERTGIPAAEVGKGMYGLESMTGYLAGRKPEDIARVRGDLFGALLKQRLTGSVGLAELTPTLAKMGGIYQGLSGTELSNISRKVLDVAAVSDPTELAAVAPRFFTTGQLGRLDARTAGAMGAFLTGKTGTPAEAASGMTTVVRKLMLNDPDEQEAVRKMAFGGTDPLTGRKGLMAKAGIGGEDNAYERLRKLSKLKLSAGDLSTLAGERGMSYLDVLLRNMPDLEATVADFHKTTGPGVDIVGGKLGYALKHDEAFRMLTAGRMSGQAADAARQDREYLLIDNFWKAKEAHFNEINASGLRRFVSGSARAMGLPFSAPDWVRGGTEKLAVEDLSRMYESDLGMTGPASRLRARETLGLDPRDNTAAIGDAALDAFRLIGSAAEKLDRSAGRTANANAHVETPAGQ